MMSGRSSTGTRHRSRPDRGNEEHRFRLPEGRPRRSPRKCDSRYESNDALGSLRSPIRPERAGEKNYNRRRSHHSEDARPSRYSRLSHPRSKAPDTSSVDEFPNLHEARYSRLAPEATQTSTSPKASGSWGDIMEDTDNQQHSRRKLVLSQGDNTRRNGNKAVRESDPSVLARRSKQIDYGKNTDCYKNYVERFPRDKRVGPCPVTPQKYHKMSRRAWDSKVKNWRKVLHLFDTDNLEKIDSGKMSEVYQRLQGGENNDPTACSDTSDSSYVPSATSSRNTSRTVSECSDTPQETEIPEDEVMALDDPMDLAVMGFGKTSSAPAESMGEDAAMLDIGSDLCEQAIV